MNIKPTEVIRINLDDIEPNPFQPRQSFNEEKIVELAENIRSQGGLIQPIKVVAKMSNDFQPIENKYYLIAGERRLRAVKKLYEETKEMEWSTIEAIPQNVSKLTPENYNSILMLQGLTENLAREDLSPVEKAEAIEMIKKETGMTYAEIGQKLGLKESTIKSLISVVNKLTPEERETAKREKQGYDTLKKINKIKKDKAKEEYYGGDDNSRNEEVTENFQPLTAQKEEVSNESLSKQEQYKLLSTFLENLLKSGDINRKCDFLSDFIQEYDE